MSIAQKSLVVYMITTQHMKAREAINYVKGLYHDKMA